MTLLFAHRKGLVFGKIGDQPTPVWEDIVLSGNTALTLTNAKADGLNYVELFGECEQSAENLATVTANGKCEQTGTPTPTTPIPITCNNGVIKVSQNIFNKNNITRVYGYIPSTGGNWKYTSSGYSFRIACTPNTTYTARYNGDSSQTVLSLASTSSNSTPSSSTTEVTLTNSVRQNSPTISTPITITTGASDKWLVVAYNVNEPENSDMANNLQIEVGSIATAYRAYGIYTDGTTETITDTFNNVANVENLLSVSSTFTDTQEVLTGVISRSIGVKVFNGTEDWTYQSTNSRFVCDVGLKIVGNRICPLLCTHYQAITDGRALADVPDYSVYGATSNNSVYLHDSRYNNASNLKAYLTEQYNAGTPVILVFPLATPTTESVTGQVLYREPLTVAGSLSDLTVTTTTATSTTPLPNAPIPIKCNNGELKLRLKSSYDQNYNVLTGIRAVGSGAWFGTGINADINTELEVEASNITVSSTQLVVANSPATTFFRIVKAGSSQKIVGSINSTSVTSNIDGTARFTAKLNKTGFYINDNLVGSIGATSTSGMGEIEVCHATYGSTSYLGSSTTFHKVTIRKNGVEVFNGVPRERISDGKIGLLDTVTNTFFSSTGSKEFESTGLDPIAYEIYADGTVETVEDSLDNTTTASMLLGYSDYADVQEVLTGEIARQLCILLLTGEETFTPSTTSGTKRYIVNLDESRYALADGKNSRGSILSTHFISIHNTTSQTIGGAFTYNKNKLYIIPTNQTYATANDFANWVKSQYQAGTPVIFIYPLLTATTETVAGQTLTTQKGTNVIKITQASIDELPLEVSYKGTV